ncbi:MAG: mechanosensitive ion channel family protein [Rubrivivax sp.]|nr:MAG: mechanosensitive ion channel family protein [Rubrivivax sp.]
MNTEAAWQFVTTQGVDLGIKVLAAMAAWIIGRWLIGLALRVFTTALTHRKRIDATLAAYLRSIVSVVLNIIVILAILDIFGVKTTSFAALLAGAGLAIGTAWGGLLAHFAAGVFMQVLRPFKVGDYIQAGGVTGTVKEIGLFGTTLVSPDSVHTIIGNNAVFGGAIQNYSVIPHRRVDCKAKLDKGADPAAAVEKLRPVVTAVPHVLDKPPPEIEILELTPDGPWLCVRPYCHTDHYSQVYFDTQRVIHDTLGPTGHPEPGEGAQARRPLHAQMPARG